MKKFHAFTVIILFVLICVPLLKSQAISQSKHPITREGYLACLTKDLFYEALGYQGEDNEAFKKVIKAGHCIIWREGVDVVVVQSWCDDCIIVGMIKVRIVGERARLWTTKQAIIE